jgi:hypothetical protein
MSFGNDHEILVVRSLEKWAGRIGKSIGLTMLPNSDQPVLDRLMDLETMLKEISLQLIKHDIGEEQ